MAIRWIQDGEPHVAEVYNRPLRDYIMENEGDNVKTTTKISVENGLTGGGQLTGDITISGADATRARKGVTRFATPVDINNNSDEVAITPNMLNSLPVGGVGGTNGGVRQTWKEVTGSRAVGRLYPPNYTHSSTSRYRNNSPYPICISVTAQDYQYGPVEGTRNTADISIEVDGHNISRSSGWSKGGATNITAFAVVPSGSYYSVCIQNNDTGYRWFELS